MVINIFYIQLYFFSFFSLIQKIISQKKLAYRCLRDELKIKNICAIEGSLTEEDETTLLPVTTNYYVKYDIYSLKIYVIQMKSAKKWMIQYYINVFQK